jgi:preprotein translocase subunit YajC
MAALLPIILLVVLMYFMLIRPQRRRAQAQQALLSAVQEGDEVMTSAGMYGFVTALDGDVAWVEIAEGVEIRVARAAIARRIDSSEHPAGPPPGPDAAAASGTTAGTAGTSEADEPDDDASHDEH